MNKKVYIETYGCQMNVADSETVASIMAGQQYEYCDNITDADIILINTCSVRDHAEQRIWNRLDHIKGLKRKKKHLITGIMGCMAQRIGDKLLEHTAVNFVAGPDAYKKIPLLVEQATEGLKQGDTEFDPEETYHDIIPKRATGNQITGFISITRGCNNFCSYCIVPYTRGRERSRDITDILNEVSDLQKNGFKEICLLGQNVNSYSSGDDGFPELIDRIALFAPEMRIRFTTSHPKDLSDDLLKAMARHRNVCNHIHLPVQSGSNIILKKMNRAYTREWYLSRIEAIRAYLPGCGISTDVFCGFCGETEEDFEQTLSIMQQSAFDSAFMFKYSERPGTHAAKHYADDVPENVKIIRLNRMIALQNKLSLQSNRNDVGKVFEVLAENYSKRSKEHLNGRTETNKTVVFPKENYGPGDIVRVQITEASSATLKGNIIQ
ncbi:MAG TPA: tRNA (N6-isopentenyl adenosine(37)-C2)-methylthiotransferase MiaB [Bacteroidales bacterium]|nr:tRNA (N6-isopentenyl adenosine(37)-C2)-methylthiotransferase MiaB [Bacteroidales bacterium]HQL69511.1 tRNA (N6-isopentenyl adenosine(37)-C2)-methylthiotransferase MiaB [Bacteroidales bacterium]